jgi:hypothetical protein
MSAPLSQYVRDCLAEDKYGLAYVEGLDGRIGTLSYAQLIDITQVLAENAETAKSATWKKANVHILQSVYKHFVPKHQKEVVNNATAARRGRKGIAQNKRRAKAQFERRAVMEQVRERVLDQARVQVHAAERKRRVEEKEKESEHMRIAEQRQWKLYIACAVYFAVFITILTVTTTSATFIASGVVAAFFSTCIGLWLTHRMGRFRRVAVSDEDLERASLELSDRLYREVMEQFKRNEQQFKGKMREDRRDRRDARLAASVVLSDEAAAAEEVAEIGAEAADRFVDLEDPEAVETVRDETAGIGSGDDGDDGSLPSPYESDVDGERYGAAPSMPDVRSPESRADAPTLDHGPATEYV